MTETEDFLKEFNKVLKTLDKFKTQLKLDLISKCEQKLIQYKKSLNDKQIDCHLSHELNNELNLKSNKSLDKNDFNFNQNVIKFNNNLNVNSNSVQVLRKSKRISNQFRSKSLSNIRSHEDIERTGRDGKTCGFIAPNVGLNETPIEEQRTKSSVSESTDNIRKFIAKPEEDKKKAVPKRRWRRTHDINDLKCEYCGKIWRSLSHLEIHLRTHTGEKTYECQHCGQRFSQLAGLQVHLRRHNNDRRFKCEICEKGFFTKIDLNRHKTTHKQFKQITHCCEVCGKGFCDKRKLKNHIRYVHEKKESVVCEICGHKTHGQHLLSAHKRAKHGESTKYACPVCQTVLGSRSAFVVHMRAHADVKPYPCNICGKQFRSASQVARHKLFHKEGRHECDVCSKKFITPHHLRRHRIIHSGNKPFVCDFCEYKCNVNSNIVKHVKTVHGLLDFSLRTQQPKDVEPPQEDALQKGSVLTQQVLKDIAVIKGQSINVTELKILDQKKKQEKQLLMKKIEENVKQRKQFIKSKEIKHKKDILDEVITSTLNDSTNLSVSINSEQHLPQIIIPGPSQVYQIVEDNIQTPKPNDLVVSEGHHFKNIITFHFTNN